ncbi:MAG: GNAT family N-acetyltransferase [Methylococcaceae bacterium]|nr:GNAT family N-acetyltransferase [Methylococcaceae bacterium]MDP2394103.1 GNAT family N-acetyltransferase [Methylococcaceae bacterium]MDP3019693.1 GNAT family N-acetyltransferase [Methylococcaceae bacterium]MDP3389971.1 GNAT family N-acetyltransferase [Methylococcaceae bacterium]MDP3933636.1 GNAT family N-acetyltransferase [Methylococcaceae bacterium]
MNIDDLFEAIDTPRTRLRCPDVNDATDIAKLVTPEVSRWLAAWPAPITEAMVVARILRARLEITEGSALHFLVERLEDRALMGWIRISRNETQPGIGDLGYWLNEAYHRCGYASEAAAQALAIGFERLELENIESGAQLENTASFAVMRKLGMEPCGERLIWAETRHREEVCLFYSVHRDRYNISLSS